MILSQSQAADMPQNKGFFGKVKVRFDIASLVSADVQDVSRVVQNNNMKDRWVFQELDRQFRKDVDQSCTTCPNGDDNNSTVPNIKTELSTDKYGNNLNRRPSLVTQTETRSSPFAFSLKSEPEVIKKHDFEVSNSSSDLKAIKRCLKGEIL